MAVYYVVVSYRIERTLEVAADDIAEAERLIRAGCGTEVETDDDMLSCAAELRIEEMGESL